MAKEKAPRNKTIDTPLSEGGEYLSRCLFVSSPVSDIEDILDKTIMGDSLSVLPLIPDGFADLIIADPPYNLSKDFGDSRFSRMKPQAYEGYARVWLSAVRPKLEKTGSVYVCCDWECSPIIWKVLSEEFKVRNRITWQREKGRGAKANWKNCLEDIWFATASDDFTFNLDAVKQRRRVLAPYTENGSPKDWEESSSGRYRDTCPSNFWDDISVPFWSMPENTAHPTQKPEKLMAKIILASSNKGDIVLDPFLGSGTVSVTAKKLERHFVGIEKEPQYCLWAQQRLERASEDKTIQGYEDGVFRERNYR
ncbi:MAG: site-specific DNA-methyltransferase [Oscillospiraceae bacterium]|nr:site-specific DNA-methyltransferase [Oscillospiraceae bacterium]